MTDRDPQDGAAPTIVAAIDAGSNAIRAEVAVVAPSGALRVIEAERVPIRLGHGAFTRAELDPDTIQDAVAAFARFRKLFDHHGVDRYRAVATSALRSAHNRDVLLHQLWYETGIDLEVIDGREEGRLVRRAVAAAFSRRTEPKLILDLGGGSLELMLCAEGAVTASATMRVGTVRLLESFGLGGAVSEDEARMVGRYVSAMLRSFASDLGDGARSPAVACGGNAEALARVFGAPNKHGMPSFTVKQLEQALPALLAADVDERMRVYGVRRDRAEVIAVAALVFATVGQELGLRRITVPGVGLREGILIELAEATADPNAGGRAGRERALLTGARSFATRLAHDTSHGEQVRALARDLFRQLAELHQLPAELGILLEVAALLHDIGEVIHRRSHHKHGEYMISWGQIPGLGGQARRMVAAVVRAHRKSPPDPARHPMFAALPKQRQKQVRKLAAILRVADTLDTDHRQRVRAVEAETQGDTIVLHLRTAGPAATPALRKTELFEQEFGLEVVFSADPEPQPEQPPEQRAPKHRVPAE